MKNRRRGKRDSDNGQMIVLMGIMLSLSIFILSSITAEISNLDVVIPSERASSLLPEFTHIKETFGESFNYNLVSNIENINDGDTDYLVFWGDITDATVVDAFEKTKDAFYIHELKHHNHFDAELNEIEGRYIWWVEEIRTGQNKDIVNHFYQINVDLSLYDGNTLLTENIQYNVICRED